MRFAPLFALSLGLCACEVSVYSGAGVSASAGHVSHLAPSPLQGWSIEGHGQAFYVAETDPGVTRDGHPTIRLHPTDDAGGAYATFMTSLDAAPFRGRRAHAFVWVRTQGVTGRGDAWLRAQGADSPADGPGLATSIVRLASNADFAMYEMVIDVPDDAAKVQMGLGIGGPGMLWMDGVKIEAQ